MAFQVVVSTPAGFPGSRLVEAAYRAGFLGNVALECSAFEDCTAVLRALGQSGTEFSVSVADLGPDFLSWLNSNLGLNPAQVILSDPELPSLRSHLSILQDKDIRTQVQITSLQEAISAQNAGADSLIAKGNESGGRVGEETTLILLQRILPHVSIPVFARGGIGLHTASACLAAGAAGVVIDWQLALCEESELPNEVKTRVEAMDGSETTVVGQSPVPRYRVHAAPGVLASLEGGDCSSVGAWRHTIETHARARQILFIGQDAAFARRLSDEFRTVKGVCQAIQRAALRQCRVASRLNVLREGGPLAESHGTRYPIVQGPMTRVSDRPDFALAVAEHGGLPLLALALMRGAEVDAVLRETRGKLGSMAWGIGILGFVPKEIREEQLAAALVYKPPFAVIAGGRPEQAKALERQGTSTYLHVPSPELLRNFLRAGARRVVFEGRECGGHVGPRTSFTLWELMVRVLLDHFTESGPNTRCEDYHVLFAGGVHDALSAAMVSAIAAPLSERGVNIGVLLGTGYLFTREAVSTAAITERFQQEAINCRETVLLDSGVGHATRCANTPFVQYFNDQRKRLLQDGRSNSDTREALEALNLGRLRIATKGVRRGESSSPNEPVYERVNEQSQYQDGMYMIGQMAVLRDRVCGIQDLHRDVSLAGQLLKSQLQADLAAAAGNGSCSSDIAIVGLSCALPGARDVERYWQNILGKVNAITEVPKSRFDADLYFNADRSARDKIYSRWGGFIEDVVFDPLHYSMPPASMHSIDPLQLLALELARAALADSGLLERRFDRSQASVIVGTGGTGELGLPYSFRSLIPHYLTRAGATPDQANSLIDRLHDELPEWTEDSFAGVLLNVAAGRIANRFDLGGTNYTVDAACATSLAAVRLAMHELESRSSDLVVVAGVDTNQSAFNYMCFSKTQALSPEGQCRPFDESADGIVTSEGGGVAVLKRLEDAVCDGDKIYAVLKGIGASSDGKDKGLTAPCAAGQRRALERAYQKAGFTANTVGLIEAHGTGTVVGDRTEIESLTDYFKLAGAEVQSCALGSVKSMIGHTKCTAGFAGLIKVALALHHRILPPTMGVTKPNSKANFPESPFYLNTESRPWFRRRDNVRRRAGISAFGFGGTNFHAALEEYEPPEGAAMEVSPMREWPAELFLWRGASSSDILSAVDILGEALDGGALPALCDLAAATYWEQGRSDGRHCLAVIATSLADLAVKLDIARKSIRAGTELRDPRGVYYVVNSVLGQGKIAFLFPGQGSQRVDMVKDLAVAFPQVREVFEQADQSFGASSGKPLSTLIFPPPAFSDDEKDANENALRQTHVAQPALGAAGMAMHGLLADLGILPDMAGGHSYGELVALCAAGTISFGDLISLSEARGRLMVEAGGAEPGIMAAIDSGEDSIAPVLRNIDGVFIANLNAPAQTVISGTRYGVEQALKLLAARGISGKTIPVACAFHSPLLGGAQQPLRQALESRELKPPRLPVYSNTTATPHPSDPTAIRDLLAEHMLRPVQFRDEVLAMYAAGARIFIEVGPGKVLTGLVARTLSELPHAAVHMDQPSRHGLTQLVHTLAQLATAGVPFLGYRLFEGRVARRLHLATLLADTRSVPLSPTAWTIRNGRAIAPPAALKSDRKDSQIAESRNEIFSPPAPAVRPAAANERRENVPVARKQALSPQGNREVVDGLDTVLSGHHQLMARFLEMQKNIMLAHLRARDGDHPLEHDQAANPVQKNREEFQIRDPAPVDDVTPGSPVVETTPALTEQAIIQRLIESVSTRTGYPPESLGLELDLEADLGIDSIKRVEIFGALQGALLLPDDVMEGMIENLPKLKTLRAIADVILQQLSDAARKQSPASVAGRMSPPEMNVEGLEPAISRFVLRSVDAPALPPSPRIDRVGPILIIGGGGVAQRLAGKLRALGFEVEVAAPDGPTKSIEKPVGILIHLTALAAASDTDMTAFWSRLDHELKSLFHFVRNQVAGPRRDGMILAATRLGGDFAIGPVETARFWPGSGAISGFIKSLACEWPESTCRTVDFESDASDEAIAEALFSELACQDRLMEIGYKNGRRKSVAELPAILDTTDSPLQLDNESVILVTGGACGITADTAIELAQRFRPKLILAGRTLLTSDQALAEYASFQDERQLKSALTDRMRSLGVPPKLSAVEAEYKRISREREIRMNISAMRQAGATVEYISADVSDDAAFGALVDSIYERFGRIDGVIHGAGIIEDKLVREKSPESFDRVLQPKISGALTLARHLQPASLKFLVFYSSVAARRGSRGQTDYAAANEALNKMAVYLNACWPARVASINWGPWESGSGMVSAALQQSFEKAGVHVIRRPSGRLALAQELLYGRKQDAEVILAACLPQPTVLSDRASGKESVMAASASEGSHGR
jgi:acyl transferase domain-containing protein/NAD(P)H-dependent flavin oxidoreductase YrpB (nitropropane dioxygenase family)/NAD(P)-dependent dehydrogenase (short-subunit alcohol dehydrogenase family)